MALIYHLLPKATWEAQPEGPYRAESLATEGFIHCSRREQVSRIANLIFANEPDLVVLKIDPQHLEAPVREEDPGMGELFPHVYGPITREAIVSVQPLLRDAEGSWIFK